MRRKVLAETQKAHDAAIAGNLRVPEGAGAIIAAAYAKSFLAKLRPQRAGNRLSVAVELDVSATGAMAAVSVTGMLAGVAIPAFMDYTKRSKKTEASLQLNKLAKSAKRAFLESNAFPQADAAAAVLRQRGRYQSLPRRARAVREGSRVACARLPDR